MNDFDAHELTTTVNCKVVGCEQEATATRGRYAKLCDTHKQEAMRAPRPEPTPLANDGDGSSIKEAAQKLVRHAGELDKALDRRSAAREQARAAFVPFKKALDELHETARRSLA